MATIEKVRIAKGGLLRDLKRDKIHNASVGISGKDGNYHLHVSVENDAIARKIPKLKDEVTIKVQVIGKVTPLIKK